MQEMNRQTAAEDPVRPMARVSECRQQEGGQTTAEYALVLLAAGTIAMLVVAWAQNTGAIGELLDAVLERITSLLG